LDFFSPIQEICRIFAPDNDFLNAIKKLHLQLEFSYHHQAGGELD